MPELSLKPVQVRLWIEQRRVHDVRAEDLEQRRS